MNENIKDKCYISKKIILSKTNGGGYVTLPIWLRNKEVIITFDNGREIIKKVNNTNKLSFPNIVVGFYVKIKFIQLS